MKESKREIIRYETNTEVKEQRLVTTKNSYVPIMKVPNIFRRLYGYAVYTRKGSRGGCAF